MEHLNKKQKKIYAGLLNIGEEIATLYLGGIELLQSRNKAMSYFLGHCLREIDGGLRDIFEDKLLKEQLQKELSKDELFELFEEFKKEYQQFDYLKNITFEEFKEAKGHISSILVSFGISIKSNIAKKYIKLARWFVKYTHRSGAFNPPRDSKDIIKIWEEFEEVLLHLIGNYYAICARMDSIIAKDTPSKEAIETLKNLLDTDTKSFYFFNKLQNPKWLAPLYEEGFFKGDLNPEKKELDAKPGFFIVPYWGVVKYLQTIAESNFKNPNDEISGLLVTIIDEIMSYRNEQGIRIINTKTDYAILRVICNLPAGFLTENHFKYVEEIIRDPENLIGYRFSEFISHLIEINDKELLLKGVELLFTLSKSPQFSFEKYESILPDYELKRILDDTKIQLTKQLGHELLDLCISLIKDKADDDTFRKFSIKTIEEHEQNFNPQNFEFQLIGLTRDCLLSLDANTVETYIKPILNLEHPIFKRLALHCIGCRYQELGGLFWQMALNPLELPESKHELYELINQNATVFSDEQISQILKWIEEKEYPIPENFKDDEEKIGQFLAYKKKEWLTALLPSEKMEVLEKYSEYDKLNNSKIDHPGFDSWMSSMSGSISPINTDAISIMSLDEIKEYYEEFSKSEKEFLGPSESGLIDSIVMAVEESPEKFLDDCDSIINSVPQIRYAWIKGISNAWKKQENLDITKSIEILKTIFKSKEFWENHNIDQEYYSWFLSNAIVFIEKGLENDSKAFDPKLLPDIKEILLTIVYNDEKEIFSHKDISMDVLNNSKGRIYLAILQYSLRLARIEKKEKSRWDTDIQDLFDKLLASNQKNDLMYFVLGQFLSNLAYLDINWLEENINLIFPVKDAKILSASMNGYLFYNPLPNKTLFKLLHDRNIYSTAISDCKLGTDTTSNLVHHILAAYLNQFDQIDLDSDLVNEIISSNDDKITRSLTLFFGNSKDRFPNKFNEFIKALWLKIFAQRIKLTNPDIDKRVLSGCCLWCVNVELDDEILDVLIQSVKFISEFDYGILVKHLSLKVDENPKKVGLILNEMFNYKIEYTAYRTELFSIVKCLYEKEEKVLADNICLVHAENGLDWFRNLFEENNR